MSHSTNQGVERMAKKFPVGTFSTLEKVLDRNLGFFQLLNNWISIGGLRWKSLSSSFYLFMHVPNRVISDWLGFREVCLQNGLLTHPLNSITPTNIYFFGLFGISYISHVKFLSHCNQSAWKYFIHKIKTNSKNFVSVSTLTAQSHNFQTQGIQAFIRVWAKSARVLWLCALFSKYNWERWHR